jgi:Ser/Thr protein kinase RdoA (MazF antagonist)
MGPSSPRESACEHFPVSHSTLCVKALLDQVLPDYAIPAPTECKLLNLGLNDTYLVKGSGRERYILRVYRRGWRSLSDILYEMDVLDHLRERGVPVSVPLRRRDGGLLRSLAAPEGERYAALFSYAPGKEPTYDEALQAYQYGRAVGAVHAATDTFTSRHRRFALDLEHLLWAPLRSVEPLLAHRPKDRAYLQRLSGQLRDRLAALPLRELDQGFCHGDFHGWNAGFAEDGTVTLYDFDCGGPGWRAYDVAVFRWCPRIWDRQDRLWPSFLRGYRELRELHDVDLRAIPLFIGVRHIWFMGVHATIGPDTGFGWIDDKYYDRELAFLRRWEAECLASENAGQQLGEETPAVR